MSDERKVVPFPGADSLRFRERFDEAKETAVDTLYSHGLSFNNTELVAQHLAATDLEMSEGHIRDMPYASELRISRVPLPQWRAVIELSPREVHRRTGMVREASAMAGVLKLGKDEEIAKRWAMYELMYDVADDVLSESLGHRFGENGKNRHLAREAYRLQPERSTRQRQEWLRNGFAMGALTQELMERHGLDQEAKALTRSLGILTGASSRTASPMDLHAVLSSLEDCKERRTGQDYTRLGNIAAQGTAEHSPVTVVDFNRRKRD